MTNAIKIIENEINKISYESEDDEGAAEWHGHLADVLDRLKSKMMSIAGAQDSLGIKLS